MIAEVLVVKASDIAKLLSKPPEGDEVSVKFGRIFEEEYSLANHLYLSAWNTKKIPRLFARKVAARLKAEGIYRRELVLKAYRAYSALLNAGVVGEKPLTQFRELADSLFIAAQPDAYDEGSDTYYEFKLYPINDYARTQTKVFAWVLQRPVVLVGLRELPGGYFKAEKEIVVPPSTLGVDPGELRKIATPEEFCADLGIPVHMYLRHPHRYSFKEDEYDEDVNLFL